MRTIRTLIAAAVMAALPLQSVAAQSVLRDAETEALLNDMVEPLAKAAGLGPRDVKVYVIGDRSINAFVVGGQAIYVNAGLIEEATTSGEVTGVLAHELGHIVGGHVLRSEEGIKKALGIQLLSMLAGVAAMAAGAGDAGAGIMMAGQQAALGKYLAFSRVQETTADAAGAKYLSAAGISGRGSLAFFKKLQNLEFRYAVPQDDDQQYGRTHPLTGDRIAALREAYVVDAAWDRPDDPAIEKRFQRVKAKLSGFIENDTNRTFRKYPASDTSIPARYARAYAWHKAAYPDRSLAEVDALLKQAPHDPYFQELKGQVLLESGRPRDAIAPLREAVAATQSQPLIAGMLGHALIASEDPALFAEAESVLRAAVGRDKENPFAWYQLGVVYEQRGDRARAALASAERFALEANYPRALMQAQLAASLLPVGSPDAIRAQDIVLVAQAETEGDRKRKR